MRLSEMRSCVRPLGAVCAACLLYLSGCQNGSAPVAQGRSGKQTQTHEAAVTQPRLESWPQLVRVQGSLLGDEQAVIGCKVPGRVEKVEVDLGTPVKQGQVLVQLDRRELQLHVEQAEAQLLQACAAVGLTPEQSETELKREEAPPVLIEAALLAEAQAAYERGKRLSQRDALSASEFDRVEAQFKTANARYQSALNSVGEQIALVSVRRAELAVARQQFDDAQVLAPFDGVVEQRHVSPGEYVQAGQAAITLVRTDKLRYTAGVPESKANLIRVGQAVEIQVQGKPQPTVAHISRISPAVTQTSRALWIEADVANDDLGLQAGLFAEAAIVVDPDAKALTVPASAVTEFAGIQKVWVIRNGEAVEQPIRSGRREADRIEILEGLTPDDRIVSNSSEGRGAKVAASGGSGADATTGPPKQGLLE